MDPKPLSLAQKQFILEILKDPQRDQTAAYKHVYVNASHAAASSSASRLMADDRIIAALRVEEATLRKNAHMTAEEVLSHISELANADPRDLSEFWRGCCRYCWGTNHLYQRRPSEHREAFEQYQRTPKGKDDPMGVFFDYQGGVGYNSKREANPSCPECDGVGVGHTHIKDMRLLTKAQARLIAGIKETKDGFQIKTRSQDKMVELNGKHLGLLRDKEPGEDDEVPPAANVSYAAVDCSKP